jgi:hypothetical protein
VHEDVRRGAPTTVVSVDVGGEGAQSAADEPGRSVGVPACPATVDQPRHSPNLLHQRIIRAPEGQLVDQLGQPRQTLQTRAALPRTLVGELPGDLRGAG